MADNELFADFDKQFHKKVKKFPLSKPLLSELPAIDKDNGLSWNYKPFDFGKYANTIKDALGKTASVQPDADSYIEVPAKDHHA